jgi:cytochrome c553
MAGGIETQGLSGRGGRCGQRFYQHTKSHRIMKTTHTMLATLAALGAAGSIASAAAAKLSPEQLEFFEKKIRPVLAEHCYKCHSANAEKLKGDLMLDTREATLKGGASGPAVVPGKPDKSLLLKTMKHEDPDLAMPPKSDKLPDNVIADFEAWIRQGAPDPREGKSAVVKMDIAKTRAEHWAFKPVTNPPAPKPKDPHGFVKSPIDAFVLAKLQEKGLTPSAQADKLTLIRRVTFDLTGLPPTPDEVDAFLKDNSAGAFAKVVDRLLASPQYGERWGRHWLDIARYADTSGDRANGGRRNPLYPYAWTYRDYVIQAFNNDVPYDRFILEQIAADRLPETAQKKETLAALGFLTVGKQFMNNRDEVIDDRIDVVTKGLMGLTAACARCHDHKFDPVPTADYYSLHGVFSSSVEPEVGPQIAGPRDPGAFEEYQRKVAEIEKEVEEYQMGEKHRLIAGMLDRAGEYMIAVHDLGRKRGSESRRLFARQRNLDPFIYEVWEDALRAASRRHDPVFSAWVEFAGLPEREFAKAAREVAAKVAANNDPARPYARAIAKAFAGKSPSSLKDVAAVYTRVLGDLQKAVHAPVFDYRARPGRERNSKFQPQTPLADPDLESLRLAFFGDKPSVDLELNQMARILGVQFRNGEGAIRNKIYVLNMTHPGSPAHAMVLEDASRVRNSRIYIRGEARNPGPEVPRQFLEVLAPERKPFKEGSGRLELARAIASRDNPLTARVFVNRVWQWHFGQAIVRTPSDFGTRAEPPTHPELLDHLASWFMDNGWSVKKLHRYILLSSTYQQDSKSNPKGLKEDPTNQWLWRQNIQRLDFESIRDSLLMVGGKLDLTMGGQPVNISGGSRSGERSRYGSASEAGIINPYRRTVYSLVDRAALPGMFQTFDFANPDLSTGERIMTTVPQQALFMMNSPLVVEQAKNLVDRKDFESQSTDEDKVRFLYRVLYQRQPTDKELQMALAFIAKQPLATTPVPAPSAVETAGNLDREKLARMTKDERQAFFRNRSRSQSSGPTGSAGRIQTLDNWERFAQVMLLSNEFIFIN